MNFDLFQTEINKILDLSEFDLEDFEGKGNVGVINIFIKAQERSKLNIGKEFLKLIHKLNNIFSFDELKKEFFNGDEEIVSLVNNIKTYNMIEKPSSNFIFINPNSYDSLDEDKTVSTYEGQIFDLSESKNLILKIKKKSEDEEKTNRLANFIMNENNFIQSYLNSLNKKSVLNKKLYNTFVTGKKSDGEFLRNMTYKQNFKTTKYVLNEKNSYSIRKIRIIDFELHNEKIITDTRITSPNTISISLIDSSYICINKIIISKGLRIGNKQFKSMKEKIKFLFEIYKSIFQFDLQELQLTFNASITLELKDCILKNDALISYLVDKEKAMNRKVNISNNHINFKYISSFAELSSLFDFIKQYKEMFYNYKQIEPAYMKNLLYFKESILDDIIDGKIFKV